MRSTSLLSIFGFALCVGAAVVACGGGDDDTASPGKLGDVGQSCSRTADCSGSLVCIDNTCQKKGTTPGAGGEGTGGSTGGSTGTTGGTAGSSGKGGTTGTGGSSAGKGGTGTAGSGTGGSVTTPPPVLSGPGESCTKTADCDDGLKCFNQRCVANETTGGGGEGGMGTNPPPGPTLGQVGDTCTLPSDCDQSQGLTCMPGGYVLGAGVGFVGICTQVNSGITPSGMDCSAECKAATDCCELPPTILSAYAIKSCADLADLLSGVDCTDPGAFADECFVQSSYCKCGTNTWKCTDGQCIFNAACSTGGLDTEGCATYSRSDRPLVSTCNEGKCQAATVDPLCTSSADCEGLTVAEGGDTCTANECTCYKATGLCYRKCSNDLDCSFGQHCDTKTTVCFDDPECDNDQICQTKNHDVRYMCSADGVCELGCKTDFDCAGSGGTGLDGEFAQVCYNGVCTDVGCSKDSECESESGVHMFCTATATVGTTDVPHSALTDGK